MTNRTTSEKNQKYKNFILRLLIKFINKVMIDNSWSNSEVELYKMLITTYEKYDKKWKILLVELKQRTNILIIFFIYFGILIFIYI